MNIPSKSAESFGVQDTNPLVANDNILPAQFYAGRKILTPIQKLALAVLRDALMCFKYGGPRSGGGGDELKTARTKHQIEAQEWFADANSDAPFSFVNVCAMLDIDVDWMREGILRGEMGKVPRAVNASMVTRVRPHRHRHRLTSRSTVPDA